MDTKTTVDNVRAALGSVMDPELNIPITDLGLIYSVTVEGGGKARIAMTLTTMGCPLFPVIESQVKKEARTVAGVTDVEVELVFDPPWTMEKMSKSARVQLGLL